MAENTSERTFYYHADANAIGGFITRPKPKAGEIPSFSSVSLSIVGGEVGKGRTRKAKKPWRGIIDHKKENAHVIGDKDDAAREWTTQSSATIEGLNILNVITADSVTAQLSVSYPYDGGEATVSVVGSQFTNLRISGKPFEPVIRYDLFADHDGVSADKSKKAYPKKTWPRQEKFIDKVTQQQLKARETYARKYNKAPLPDWIKNHFNWLDSDQGLHDRDYLICSLIDQLPDMPENFPGATCGHGIYIPDFGRVYFGELVVHHHAYRLSMIRAQLGSPVGAAVSVATANLNGSSDPPGGI
jgi:hypothetical protein